MRIAMKILSNFDTQAPLEAYQKALAHYGADKVIFLRRHKVYLTFFVVLPAVLIGLVIIASFFVWQYIAGIFSPLVGNIFTAFFSLLALLVLARVVLNYIKYFLDYTIVTPRLITSYNQTGFFKREIRTIDTDKIKTITVSGRTFIQSLFNFGTIVFLSEGDDDTRGDITLHYLRNIDDLKDEVVRIIDLASDE